MIHLKYTSYVLHQEKGPVSRQAESTLAQINHHLMHYRSDRLVRGAVITRAMNQLLDLLPVWQQGQPCTTDDWTPFYHIATSRGCGTQAGFIFGLPFSERLAELDAQHQRRFS